MKGLARKKDESREVTTLEVIDGIKAKRTETLKNTLSGAIQQIILLMICVAGMIAMCAMVIGNGAYTYNEDTYREIEKDMLKFADTERTVSDLKNLEAKVGNVHYDYSTKSGTKLVCNRRNGFFNAKVKTYLSDDKADKPELDRNFHSRNGYMLWFWFVFGASVVVGSFLLWLICNCIPYALKAIYQKVDKLINKVKEVVNERNLKKGKKA